MKAKKIITILLLGVLFNACNKGFLDEVPTEDIAAATATATTKNMSLVLNGIHRSLYLRYGSQGRGGVGALMILNECLGDDYVMTGRANGWFINAYQWNDHTNELDLDDLFPYRTYYRIIRNANTIINGAEKAEGLDIDRKSIKGQALIYRAWSYFQLVQLYGERYISGTNNTQAGVPLRLKVTAIPKPRNTVEEVYTQINKDLDEAIDLLNGYARPNKSNLNKSVALGLKARVALVQGEYEVAVSFAQQAQQGYTLMNSKDYFNNFSDYSSGEWMWGSHIQTDQTLYFANYGAYISRNFSSSNIRGNPKAINSKLYDLIPSSDVRSTIFDPSGLHKNLPNGVSLTSSFQLKPYTSQKFIAVNNSDSRMDIPYMRVSEMYLIEAEAKAKSLSFSDAEAAQALYKMAIVRDPSYTLSTKTGADLIEEILLQRRWELWGEGFRFYDLKRLNMPLDRTGANHKLALAIVMNVPAGDPRWQWKIPQRALDANPLLEQNP